MASLGLVSVHPLRVQREIDHHDGVLLHHAEQHDQPYERVQIEILVEQLQSQQRAEDRRRQSGKNGEGVDEALVENPQDDVDHQDGDDQQDRHAAERFLELLDGALEIGAQSGRHAQFLNGLIHPVGGLPQRKAGRQVERYRHRGKLSEMSRSRAAPRCASSSPAIRAAPGGPGKNARRASTARRGCAGIAARLP